MWPKRNTAFVIIHGAGSHRPYETLDRFVRGFWTALKSSSPDLTEGLRHRLHRREDWVEHYVSLDPEGKPKLDFYEYYWDYHVDHRIGLRHIIQWLDQVSESAKSFYAARPELAIAHQQEGSDLFQDGDFKLGGYFIHFGLVGQILRFLQLAGIARIPFLSTIILYLLDKASQLMVTMMGDVVVYTTADVRSKNYEMRQRVLAGAVEEITRLLERDDYDQIILAGYSLGSLIAYDALNRIIVDVNTRDGLSLERARKIAGFVTFGSPLDKVAFFFRDHTRDEEFVRRQILAHQHSFKRRPFPGDDTPVSVETPIKYRMDAIRWLNFYHLNDPVSGHLDAYDVSENILCDAAVDGVMEAHMVYWQYLPMYHKIASRFFSGPLEPFLAGEKRVEAWN